MVLFDGQSNVKGEVLAPVQISSKFVIVKTGSGELIALDKDNGEIVWSYRSKLQRLLLEEVAAQSSR